MEKINSHNYEAFFLDYMEGTLSAQQEFELIDFLDRNPDLKAELEFDFEDVTLQDIDKVSFDKSVLKKEGIQPDEVDDLMIASVEGTLSVASATELQNYVQSNNLGADYKYYQNTLLKPDLSVGYGNKSDLKKKDGFFVPIWARFTAAAGIAALLIGVSVTQFSSSSDPVNKHEQALEVLQPENIDHAGTEPKPEANQMISVEEETWDESEIDESTVTSIAIEEDDVSHSEELIVSPDQPNESSDKVEPNKNP